jgi:predicted enzyme related to lactoylglutathione lyase
MAGQLQAAGIEVKIDPQSYPNGRFARVHDPEGNPIELWQPKVSDTSFWISPWLPGSNSTW